MSRAELINGAGSSFAYPIYSKWASEYQKMKTDVRINYQSIGSGAGIRQIINQTVDFAGSDAPMKDDEMAKAVHKIQHIPTVLGAVVLAFNLPSYSGELKLTPDLVVKIYSGKITRWNDPELLKLNPNLAQAALETPYILAVQRSDGSGTTSIFTDYLSQVSKEWKDKIGKGKSVDWPTGLQSKGNEGVTGVIRQNPGAIGYVEMTFALSNNLSMALLQNKSGSFIKPSVETVTAAAENVVIPDDMRMSIVNSTSKKAYSISSFTYMLVPQVMPPDKGKNLVDFISWAITDGQVHARKLHYAPLPQEVVAKIQSSLKVFQYKLN
ncbi:MAG: phosphate ABC transporter substrate-binding protein PstS [Bdellovibrionaceae bacterium]|nr:phosphate ABC transporter substrate-binding protein PstS [Pseudobdellovibrionaceae bacterium]